MTQETERLLEPQHVRLERMSFDAPKITIETDMALVRLEPALNASLRSVGIKARVRIRETSDWICVEAINERPNETGNFRRD